MRILSLHLDAELAEPCEIEALLSQRVLSPDRLVAARWQMLLDLIAVLRADGPHPEAWGYLQDDELSLSPGNPANPVTVRVRTDWRDFGPLHDGLPQMHFRLQIARHGAKLSRDARAKDAEEAARIIREAFGWSR